MADINTNIFDIDGGRENVYELIPNGANIRVTDTNKSDFIVKKCHYLGYKFAE